MKRINREGYKRMFHQAKWDEPVIFELSRKGERGILIPGADKQVEAAVGDGISKIPEGLRRKEPPALPEIAQHRVLRHYLRLSQETLGADLNSEIGQGTCSMKYSPKINERLARMPQMTELHPFQDESTVQGILEIMYKTDLYLREISGMSRFTLQAGGGSQALMAMVSILRAKHEAAGETGQRNEIITTIFSHPSGAAAAALQGFKVVTLYSDEDGYISLDTLKNAVSERTAGLIITNPEDTGLFNFRIREFTDLVHQAGGICCYDQANANSLLGIARAKEAGFDMCFFNLHKTFSAPHGCGGPGSGAVGVVSELEKFLPVPVVEFVDGKYSLNYNVPETIGKVRLFYGVPEVVLKAYAWIMSLGADGLHEVSRVAVLNNNYLYNKVLKIRGAGVPFGAEKKRLEQTRYTWEKLTEETGVTSEDIQCRMADYAHHYWTSHHPFIVPEPFTLEPTETTTKEELDEYAECLAQISKEAYENPELVRNAPYNSCVHKNEQEYFDDPEQWAITWRAYLKKAKQEADDVNKGDNI